MCWSDITTRCRPLYWYNSWTSFLGKHPLSPSHSGLSCLCKDSFSSTFFKRSCGICSFEFYSKEPDVQKNVLVSSEVEPKNLQVNPYISRYFIMCFLPFSLIYISKDLLIFPYFGNMACKVLKIPLSHCKMYSLSRVVCILIFLFIFIFYVCW